MSVDPAALAYDDRGLVPVVVQDTLSGAVLMVAWANREAVERTIATGEAHFWSRSREKLWRKGETSGNTLRVVEVQQDCDGDALLVRAEPAGPTCHLGTRSCFEPNAARFELGWLWQILEERRRGGDSSSYTARLLSDGIDRIARKVGEEAGETIIAAVRADNDDSLDGERQALVAEAADLVYHLLVLLLASGVGPEAVGAELARRHRRRVESGTTREQGA